MGLAVDVTGPDPGALPVTEDSFPCATSTASRSAAAEAQRRGDGRPDARPGRPIRRSNRLWLQGGTTTDPVLYGDPQFAGRYGFGALRCAIDDLNGDNVETIQFPTGPRHMFCYAYYVTPPPSSGTIVIRKQVEGARRRETFHYTGNLSYNAGGAFDLSARTPPGLDRVRARRDAPRRRAVDGGRGRPRKAGR